MATTSELDDSLIPAEPVEYELECPRCHGVMCLCSETETLLYACEECDFILHALRKKE